MASTPGPTGDRYEGEFRDSKQNGRGVNTWANGDRYEGEIRDGKAHGPGIRTDASGQTYNGIWRDGCFRDGNRRAWIGASEAKCRWRLRRFAPWRVARAGDTIDALRGILTEVHRVAENGGKPHVSAIPREGGPAHH